MRQGGRRAVAQGNDAEALALQKPAPDDWLTIVKA
jgi:hypothetical protein